MAKSWPPTWGWKDHSLNHLVGFFFRIKIVVGFVRIRKDPPHKRPLLYLFFLGGGGLYLVMSKDLGVTLVPGRVQNAWSAGSVFVENTFWMIILVVETRSIMTNMFLLDGLMKPLGFRMCKIRMDKLTWQWNIKCIENKERLMVYLPLPPGSLT